jgi:DNA-directed RNA polymerase subunit omega
MKKEIIYDDLLKKIPNKYVLAIVAGKRARDLVKGDEPLVKTSTKETLYRKTLLEVLDGKVGMIDSEEEE